MRATLRILAASLLAAGCTGEASLTEPELQESESTRAISYDTSRPHGIMRPDSVALKDGQTAHRALPQAAIDTNVNKFLRAALTAGVPTSVNLMPYLSYPQSQREQGNCGDCWVWGSTAVAEINLGVQGVKDALSVQYFNSAYTADFACCGGYMTTFASWYASKKAFVPLSNSYATFADASTTCEAGKSAVAASKIPTTGAHTLTSLKAVSIATTDVGQATAIENIKNVLRQNKAVAYSYYLPTDPAWTNFYSFWDNQSETALWNPDTYSGKAWNNGGGHLVAIIGYDDSDSNSANHYWIALNSWGVTSKRPGGTFRLAQKINYDSYFTDNGYKYDSHIFETMEITWPATSPLAITTQPQAVTVASGQPVLFQVAVGGGTQPYSYQWRKNGSALSGATAASYSLAAAASNDQGSYDVVIKDASQATVTSKSVALTVTSCVPACSGKTCGSDGCGGSCGSCSGSTTCSASGQCVGGTCSHAICTTGPKLVSGCDPCVTTICASDSYCCNNSWDSVCVGEVKSLCKLSCDACVPSCNGKTCGSDGCGGSCGTCAAGSTCNGSGQCVASCTPSCSGKACGSDGCGGTCGTCNAGYACDSSGQCVATCTPSCSGKSCGSDGCGGTCGSCNAGYACNGSGQCIATCTPSCSGKSCGSDGCGGTCGTCNAGYTCNGSGQCVTTCTPSCSGKSCGSDGCGGTCGTCAAGSTCDASGQCVATCTPSCAGKSCGSDGCGGTCGACAAGSTCDASGQCIAVCTPSCTGKSCGSDGCGGTCGTCAAGSTCDASGQCIAPTSGKLVINEVSTRGASGTDEYIELFNASGADIDLSGYKLYYRAASTTTGFGSLLTTFGSVVLPAGKHLLVASGGYTGAVTPDATFTSGIADSGSAWLFKAAAGGTGLSRADANFVDQVGWGTAVAANVEGSAAPSPSTAYSSVSRTAGVDTDVNGADFTLVKTRTPESLASP